MALTPEERSKLIDIIIRVPASFLLDVVDQQDVIEDFETLRKQITEEVPAEARRAIIGAVVDRYDKDGSIPLLCGALASRVKDPQLREDLEDHAYDPKDDAAKQRATSKRANTFHNRSFRKFMDDMEPKICLVFARDGRGANSPSLGTGFLVGPDLVLTTYHTLKNHIRPPDPNGSQPNFSMRPRHAQDDLYAIFDHYDGAPITDQLPANPALLTIQFAPQWLECCCLDMPGDGHFAKPSVDQLKLLPNCLDFALVRLAKPVGNMPRNDPSGLLREWIDLKQATNSLKDQDGIFLLQHPEGYSQRFSQGLYSEKLSKLDSSYTRIRYSAASEPGTSGAPCFNHHYKLVGLHNAEFRPNKKKKVSHNQAIRADRIREAIERRAQPAYIETQSSLTFWNASIEVARPDPILRRNALLNWIEEARQDTMLRAQRIYAAIAVDGVERAGRTFTTDILFASLRDKSDVVVPLGNREQLPATIADFMRVVGYLLRLPEAVLTSIPPRPDSTHPGGADGDKLRKWASEEVPNWFAGVLAAHREAASNWDRIWIVLDRLEGGNLSDEVKDLIAGLIGITLEESRVNRELVRIRWLFLGFAPDFLTTADVTPEELDPAQFDEKDVIECVGKMLRRAGKPFSMAAEGALINTLIAPMSQARKADLADPRKRLQTLQDIARRLIGALADLMGLQAPVPKETIQ